MSDKDLFLKKFEEKLKKELTDQQQKDISKDNIDNFDETHTTDYEKFRKETLNYSSNVYERWCNIAEKIFPVQLDEKTTEKIEEDLENAHILTSAKGVAGLSLLVSLTLLIIGMTIFITNISSIISIGIILIGIMSFFILQKLPSIFAKQFKAKSSDQIIMAIFYIVAYMRFNSNFELAVSFAAHYLGPPMSLDFKRIIWRLNNSEYPNLKVAFDDYLEKWRDENLEFLEAIYLIESSLYESEENRRISLLDKSLDIILEGNYEKMLHFAQELKGKVSTFNMLGIVLPILLLIILPLLASLGSPKGVWEFILILYIFIIPVIVIFYSIIILTTKPAGTSTIKKPKIKNIKLLQMYKIKLGKKDIYVSAKIPAFTILIIFLLIGLSPLITHFIIGGGEGENSCMNQVDIEINSLISNIEKKPFDKIYEFKSIDDKGNVYCYGPYGLWSSLISLFIPLAFAFSIGYFYRIKYKNLINLRDKTKKLEKEFPTATFQLGNRINEGISTELAFGLVADSMRGTETGEFFSKIDSNIKFNGMSIERSIFDSKKGAINTYPSELIESSMKIIIRAIEKGPEITAKTLIDLSRYLNEIHLGQERMKDLLSESISSMKSQASFLAPLISGIVISIVSLITLIMGTLTEETKKLGESTNAASVSNFLGDSIPTYLFQSVVGTYIVILIIILIYMITNLENGEDKIYTKYQIGEKVISGMTKYSIIIFFGVIIFSFLGASVISGL